MVNMNKLRGRMVERDVTVDSLAKALNMNVATLYRRFGEPEKTTVGEVKKIKECLGLSAEDVEQIFFAQ